MLALLLSTFAIAVLVTVAALTRRAALRLGRDTLKRLPLDTEGIIVGARDFELARGADAPAVLLIHGGGDTPQTLRYIADYLWARGYHVRAPLLPGHGRTPRAFSNVRAGQWMETIRDAYRELSGEHTWVSIAGLSMGGALAAQLLAEEHSIPAAVLLAPYLAMPARIALAARLAPLWAFAVPYVRALDPAARRSIRDENEAARSLAYGIFTPAALRALRTTVARATRALPRIKSPTLMIQSREDNRIPPDAAQRAFDHIGAADKKLVWVTGAGHVITVDYGRDHVFELVADWLDGHCTPASRATSMIRAQ
ncbi:MAG TPA: alpha/beta fold hydrolase [Gemmatimonadaceae bacterium]|nr:alpha/beta fold hydrolase [Gemmatimonadaceae bacterium]